MSEEVNSGNYISNGKVFEYYKSSLDGKMKNHEKSLFCNHEKYPHILQYKLFSGKEENTYTYIRPCLRIGSLDNFYRNPQNKLFEILQKKADYSLLCRKWIHQIIYSMYAIHKEMNSFHGNLSDFAIFIDENLNAQIGSIGISYIDTFRLQDYPFLDYYESKRLNILEIKQRNKKDYMESEMEEQASTANFQQYDIYALGILLRQIINKTDHSINKEQLRYTTKEELENNGNNEDQTFNQKIENRIIKQCLKESDRITIDEIKSEFDKIMGFDLRQGIATAEDIFQDFSQTKGKTIIASHEIVAEILTCQKELVCLFNTSSDNDQQLKLHDNYIFQTSYDCQDKCFLTKPILVEGGKVIRDFEAQIHNKMINPIYQNYFFNNIYFCSLKEFLGKHRCTYDEIHYWMIYLINYLMLLYSDNQNDHFPLNFSSETIFVSFINYTECKNIPAFKDKPLQFQLSVFPFNARETNLSQLYRSGSDNRSIRTDVFSLGVLLLELLYNASTGENCFNFTDNDEIDCYQLLMNTQKQLESKLPDDQKFYIDILKVCFSNEGDGNSLFFSVYELLSLKGRDYGSINEEITEKEEPTLFLNQFVSRKQIMDTNRFINLFKIYDKYSDEEKIFFVNTLNRLCENCFENVESIEQLEEFNLIDILRYLKMIDSIKKLQE